MESMKNYLVPVLASVFMFLMGACTPSAPTAESGLQTAVPTAIPKAQSTIAIEIDAELSDLVQQQSFTGSVLIARDSEILLSKGYGLADREKNIPNTPETRFRLGSLTKQFTAMAVMILQAQGRLDVQDQVCNYIADCPADWQGITLHHLLTHTSGVRDFTSMSGYAVTQGTPSAPEETIARFKDQPLDFQPGARWRYSNSGYVLLGYVIEQASDQSYERFLQKNIFEPLEMRNTGYDHNDNSLATGYANIVNEARYIDMSIPYAAGGLYSTVEDLYRWDQALNTEQLLPQELIDLIFTPHSPTDLDTSYGYGWEMGTLNNHRVDFHGGNIEGFATEIRRYLDDRVTIIVLSNQQDLLVNKITDSIAAVVFKEN
jgi:CubicO group peptidase (beta-lactamase class C family)